MLFQDIRNISCQELARSRSFRCKHRVSHFLICLSFITLKLLLLLNSPLQLYLIRILIYHISLYLSFQLKKGLFPVWIRYRDLNFTLQNQVKILPYFSKLYNHLILLHLQQTHAIYYFQQRFFIQRTLFEEFNVLYILC